MESSSMFNISSSTFTNNLLTTSFIISWLLKAENSLWSHVHVYKVKCCSYPLISNTDQEYMFICPTVENNMHCTAAFGLSSYPLRRYDFCCTIKTVFSCLDILVSERLRQVRNGSICECVKQVLKTHNMVPDPPPPYLEHGVKRTVLTSSLIPS